VSAFSAQLLDHDDVTNDDDDVTHDDDDVTNDDYDVTNDDDDYDVTNDDDDVALDCLRFVALVAVIDDVVEVFETGGDLVAAGVVELDEFGLDVPALVRVEVSPLEGGHAVVGEVLEAGAPHVVVGVALT